MLMAIDRNKELANKGVEDTWEFIKLKYDEVVDLCIPCVGCKKKNKKAVLPQGNRAMPQVFFSVEVRQQHSLQV